MGRGIIESGLFRTEQLELEQRTSDPANPEPNERWVRVDIKPTYEDANGTTQTGVAQYRVANADGSVDTAPVAAVGDPVGQNVIDKDRVHVTAGGSPTGTGFIPHATTGASYPNRKLEHPTAGQVAMHDALTASAIPDSAVLRHPADEGSGTTLADSVGSNDGVLGQDNWTSGTWVGDTAPRFDGVDDTGYTPYASYFDQSTWTYLVTVELQSSPGSGERIYDFFSIDNYGHTLQFYDNGTSLVLRVIHQTSSGAGNEEYWDLSNFLSTGTKYRLALTYDNGTMEIFSNATSQASNAFSSTFAPVNGNLDWHYASNQGEGSYLDCVQDNPIFSDSVLTQTEIQNDYDRQPWS
jgi:hypothetical protein